METSNLLDKRLKTIANLVSPCNLVLDVGTDHGFIPIYLVSEGIAKHCIASDNKIGPLNKAKENIKAYNLNDKIDTILADGLDKMPENIDYVVIAGMGGHLISSILQRSKNKYNNLVLQANSHNEILRETLMNLGYSIEDEEIIEESNIYYEIIKATKGNTKLSNLEIKYGPINLKKKSKAFINMLENRINTLKNILNELVVDSPSYNIKKKEIEELENIVR